MKSANQKKVWSDIAREWYEFRTEPVEHTQNFLKNKTGEVLDLGGGAGRHLQKIAKGKMYLVDFSEEMIKLAKKRAKEKNIEAEFAVAEITKLPFKDNFFDCAIAIAVFHCIKGNKKKEKAVKELFRVMKPRAQAEIAVWNKDSRRFEKSPKERYVRWKDRGERYYYLFNAEEIYELFEKAGFKIIHKESPQRNIVFIVEKPRN